jgi:ABC-type Fe3+ transport system permease subunit
MFLLLGVVIYIVVWFTFILAISSYYQLGWWGSPQSPYGNNDYLSQYYKQKSAENLIRFTKIQENKKQQVYVSQSIVQPRITQKSLAKLLSFLLWWLGLWCLTTLSTIFQLYRVILVEKTGVPRENHRPATSHWQTLSHNVVSSTLRLSGSRTHNVSGDKHWLQW